MRQASGINVSAALLALLAMGVVLCLGLSTLAGYNTSLDGQGLSIRNPRAEAEATRTAQQALDDAAQREMERQLWQTRVEAAKPALIVRDVLLALAVGIGGLVLAVGGAFALAAWFTKRATTIYPNAAGQYPVITRRGFGWVVVHDPNRGLGPTTMYRTPTLLDGIARIVRMLRGGQWADPSVPPVQPVAEFPPTASESTMAQIAGQAQAIGLVAAATRPQSLLGNGPAASREARQLAGEVMRDAGVLSPGRMPSVRVIEGDTTQTTQLLALFEGGE